MTNLQNIRQRTWNDLLAEQWGNHQPPLTVHLPIQPAHSRDFIHVDCALNAGRRRVFPNLNCDDVNVVSSAGKAETMLVEFALGNPPSVPDFRRTKLSLEDGHIPIATAEYCVPHAIFEHVGLLHRWQYACCPVDDEQSILAIHCTVTNETSVVQESHVRAKVVFPIEDDIFEYHYISYYWDATKYPPCDKVSLQGDRILRSGQVMGKVIADAFNAAWEKEANFPEANFATRNAFIVPSRRLKSIQDSIHFKAKLAPGETRQFQLILLTNFENVQPAHLDALAKTDWESAHSQARRHFATLAPDSAAELTCPANQWDEIFAHMPISIEQLLVRSPGTPGLVATQGGSSERHYVWVWEVTNMMLPMLRLGRFQPVRNAIEFVFSLQDGGCPPKGRLTTTKGSIGTTGPKWLNTTGSALAMAADYYRYSRDEDFLNAFLPRILSAMNWIIGEISATRKLNADGRRPLTYGLMPFGCATDGDIGHVLALTDSFTYWGLDKATKLLEHLRHSKAAEFRRETDQYKKDLNTTIAALVRSDGFIPRAIVTGDKEEVLFGGFDAICGAFHLAFCGVLDVRSEMFRKYVDYFETNLTEGCFTGKMARDYMYMGVGEWAWQDIYLRMGEWKKAWAMAQINFRYGVTPDTHQAQERFCLTDPAFCPWQPNGSGNGRALDMILKSFWFEDEGIVTLLGGIPFAWLRQNQKTALRNLHTPHGVVHIEAIMLDQKRCRLRLTSDVEKALPGKFRFPEHLSASAEHSTSRELRFILTDAENPHS